MQEKRKDYWLVMTIIMCTFAYPVNALTHMNCFTINLPTAKTEERERTADYASYRFQNFKTDVARSELESGEYYLELYLFAQNRWQDSCESLLKHSAKYELGNRGATLAYRMESEDSGGVTHVLCMEGDSGAVLINLVVPRAEEKLGYERLKNAVVNYRNCLKF